MLDSFLTFLKDIAPHALVAVIVIVVGLLLSKLLLKLLDKVFAKSKAEPTVTRFIMSLLKVILYIITIIIALTTLGVDLTSIIALMSVAGLAVSLAVQNSLSNLAGGVTILFSKPFVVGDFIDTNGISGTVEDVSILRTKLLTPDNKAIYIPNGQISSGLVVNYSSQPKRRLDLTFSVAYKDDFKKAKSIISDIVSSKETALTDPAPTIRVTALSAHSVDIVCRVWVKPENYWDLNFDLIEDVKLAFDAAGISFPFNQIDVHMDK